MPYHKVPVSGNAPIGAERNFCEVEAANEALSGPPGSICYSKGAHLMPQNRDLTKDYNQVMRYYTTKQVNDGGITFKCIYCEYAVTTLNFDIINGNRRTQAAVIMNQHAAELHVSRPRTSGRAMLDDRGAL